MAGDFQIYLVDDGDDYRFLAGKLFERFLPQYSIRFFASGDELYQHIESTETIETNQKKPCFILLDLHMPGRNGLQTLIFLKQHPEWQRIPVVMMSNTTSEKETDACYEAGVNSFLNKPTDPVQLKTLCETACYYWLSLNRLPSLKYR